MAKEERKLNTKQLIVSLLKDEANEYRRQADFFERIGDIKFSMLRANASTIERMIEKINQQIKV